MIEKLILFFFVMFGELYSMVQGYMIIVEKKYLGYLCKTRNQQYEVNNTLLDA